MRRTAPVALALVVAAGLTACGDDSEEAGTDSPTSGDSVGQAPAGAPGVQVEAPRDIAELLGCTGSFRTEESGSPLVAQAGSCEVTEDRVRLLTFASAEDQTAYIQESVGLDRVFSGGRDWLVQSPSRSADSGVREALGWKKEA